MTEPYPLLDVVALIIGRRGQLLLDYKQSWATFALPITKIRTLPTLGRSEGVVEPAVDAAVRAAVEVLGVPLGPERVPERIDAEVAPYHQSGRDGAWKRYAFHLYGMNIDFDPRPLPGHVAVWVDLDAVLTHKPISPTTSLVLNSVPMEALRTLLS